MINETNLPKYIYKRIEINEITGCWEWRGLINSAGYGICIYKKKKYRIHRLVYKLITEEVPAYLDLHHECTNRKCCNPKHLKPLTRRENVQLVDKTKVKIKPKQSQNSKEDFEFFYKILNTCIVKEKKTQSSGKIYI